MIKIETIRNLFLTNPIQYLCSFKSAGTGCGIRHCHDGFELLCHIVGDGEIRFDDGTVCFNVGSWELVSPGVNHTQINYAKHEDVCLIFDLQTSVPIPPFHIELASNPELLPMLDEMRLLAEIGKGDFSPWYTLEMNGRTATVVAQFLKTAENPFSGESYGNDLFYIEQAEKKIRKNGFSPIRLGELAACLGITPDYLRHCYRKHRKYSLKTFQRCVQLEFADQLMTYSCLTLKEIADRCGFGSASHFCSVYRTARGISPGKLRK